MHLPWDLFGILYFDKVINTGGVFAFLSSYYSSNIIFALLNLFILLLLIYHEFQNYVFGVFILAGGILNLFDRIIFSGVFDYCYIKFFGIYSYVFNLADLYILLGIALLFVFSSRLINDNCT
ncbi:MAG: signal peptidase II [Pseudomonadota bacterium]